MHLQPLYAGCEVIGGRVGADLYARGICLPSSSSLAAEDQDRVIGIIRGAARASRTVKGAGGNVGWAAGRGEPGGPTVARGG